MGITVRAARGSDAGRIGELIKGALGYACEPETVRAQLEKVLNKPAARVFVAADDLSGVTAGFVYATEYDLLHAASLKSITSLAVDEAWRGKGIGRMLTEAVERWAREDGCAGVRLVCSVRREKAHGFYLHCGYTLRKEQKSFIKYL